MLFSDTYYSIESPAEGIYKDRGSKFLAYVYPVKSQAKIKEHLDILKSEHPSAVHHCYAWRLGADKLAFRMNDDGEPSGTAGKPIFAQIQSQDLTDILVVVVRYFGGSLLGVPGLIQAYKSATLDALSKARILELFVMEEFRIEFDNEDISTVMFLLKSNEAQILSQHYNTRHELFFRIRKSKAQSLEEKLKSVYKAKLSSQHNLSI